MDRFQELTVFVAVADAGGFAAAAKKLGLSPPAVTRAIAGLEARLGTALFVRTTRRVRLTESGVRFLEDARRILSDLREAEDSATGLHADPQGLLSITAPVLLGQRHVAPALADMLEELPKVAVRAVFLDRNVNLIEEGFDLAIRVGDLPDSSMVARRVGSVRVRVAASPAYLARQGVPKVLEDLREHRVIHASAVSSAAQWRFMDRGEMIQMKLPMRLNVNSNQTVLDLVEQGWGVGRLLSYQLAPLINAGKAIPLLEEFALPEVPIHIVHAGGRTASAKLRSAMDFLAARLRSEPALNTDLSTPLPRNLND